MILRDSFEQIPDTDKSEKPIKNIGIDESHLKCDCVNGSIVNGVREHILFSFGLGNPLGHKIHRKPRIQLFKEVNKCILSHIAFYLEDDDHIPLGFNGEAGSLTCHLIKI